MYVEPVLLVSKLRESGRDVGCILNSRDRIGSRYSARSQPGTEEIECEIAFCSYLLERAVAERSKELFFAASGLVRDPHALAVVYQHSKHRRLRGCEDKSEERLQKPSQ